MDQRVRHQLSAEGIQGGEPLGIGRRDESRQRHHQDGGVQDVVILVLHERLTSCRPAPLHDPPVDVVAGALPPGPVGGQAATVGHADGALDGHPAHQPRVQEFLAPAAGPPDALIGLVPVVADPVDETAEALPRITGDGLRPLVVQVQESISSP